MDAILMLLTALAGWGFAIFITIESRKDEREVKAAHAAEIERKDENIRQLLDQVQLNSQHLPYYPTVGPFPVDTSPEPHYMDDGMGYLAVTEEELAEMADAFAEVDRT